MSEKQETLTITEAAEELGISRWTVRNYVQKDRIPSRMERRGRQSVRVITRVDLERFKNPYNPSLASEASLPRIPEEGLPPSGTEVPTGKELMRLASDAGKASLLEQEVSRLRVELEQHQEALIAVGQVQELRARLADRDGENEERRLEVQDLREEIAQLRQDHVVELRRLRQEHAVEISELRREVEAAKLGAFVGLTQAVAVRDAVRKLWG